MKSVVQIELPQLRDHEKRTKANVTLGGYGMDKHCPVNEFNLYFTTLDADDLSRTFLLGEFAKYTAQKSGRLMDVITTSLDATPEGRVQSFISPAVSSGFKTVDLRNTPALAPVLVTPDVGRGAVIAIDGNHRLMAQVRMYEGIDKVPVFVCEHPAITNWAFVPRLAREFRK